MEAKGAIDSELWKLGAIFVVRIRTNVRRNKLQLVRVVIVEIETIRLE